MCGQCTLSYCRACARISEMDFKNTDNGTEWDCPRCIEALVNLTANGQTVITNENQRESLSIGEDLEDDTENEERDRSITGIGNPPSSTLGTGRVEGPGQMMEQFARLLRDTQEKTIKEMKNEVKAVQDTITECANSVKADWKLEIDTVNVMVKTHIEISEKRFSFGN